MSFSDHPMLSTGQKIGCLVYTALGTLLILFGLVGAVMGDCADGADTSCKHGTFWLFPGPLVVIVLGGILMLWFFTRSRRR